MKLIKRFGLFAGLMFASPLALAATTFAVGNLIDVLIWLLIAACVYWLVLWVIAQVGPPEPFAKIIKVILAVIVFIIVLNALLSLVGGAFISFR